jgi:hypothetical protein
MLVFQPERWGQVEKFRKLWPSTYHLDRMETTYLAGVEGHFHKFQVLRGLATEILPRLERDKAELEEANFTNAAESRKLAAVVEAMLGELYSALDCTRRVLAAIFPKATPNIGRGLGPFLADAGKGSWKDSVPNSIREALGDTTWFDEPRELRNHSVHSDPGSCHWGTKGVSYMASKPPKDGPQNRVQVVDDILGRLDGWATRVNATMGAVFKGLNDGLSDDEVNVPCGIYNFRFYERFIRPSEATTFHGGRCKSRSWFDGAPDENKCPLRDRCGAFAAGASATPA